MASAKIQKGMVFLKGGPTALAVEPAADHPAVPLRPAKRPKRWTDQSALASSEEPEFWDACCRNSSIVKMDEQKHLSSLNTHAGNLSADSTCKRVKVTLDNNSMWKDFFSCGTEMIVTKQGNRMFPYCRFRITGLHPSKNYCLLMDIHPLDGSQHKWNGNSWQVCRKAERHIKTKPFVHPESLATGEHWMQSPVSFYRLKLTNNISDQEENIILHPMHRYLPRLHVVQTDKAPEEVRLNGPNVLTFTFPQTEFMAVTAYQNPQLAQLKVNYNPFAKGLKEEGSISWSLKVKSNSSKVLITERGNAIAEQHPVKKSLKSLLANHKPRCPKTVNPKPTDPPAAQRNSTAHKDQSTVKVTAESSRSRPTQKLFSELIRDAHVSLQRCNMDSLDTSHITASGATQTRTHTTVRRTGGGQAARQRDGLSVKALKRKTEVLEKRRKAKDEKHIFSSSSHKDSARTKGSDGGTSPIRSQNSSESVDLLCVSDTSEATRHPKRPARLPLPALALFLKQHSTKLKKTTSKPDTSPAEPASGSRGSDAVSKQTEPEPITESCTHARVEEASTPERAGETHQKPSIPSSDGSSSGAEPQQPNSLGLVYESSPSELLIPDVTPVLATSSLKTPTPPPSTCTTSSSILNEVLPSHNSLPTSTLPPEPHPLKTESSLPDPECSSFDFEPLSPASSPEPLPSLPASLALELDSTASEAAFPTEQSDDLLPNRSSVFKWHTVLPPSEPYVETPFGTFQPAIGSAAPLLPCHTEPQDLNSSPSLPSSEPPPSFQDCEQLLPFPAELSPLALQLPLSPTFSLDGERLSPTPSLTDLVQFFSVDEDTGIGTTFPNSEAAVPISLPPSAETHEPLLPAPPDSVQKCRRRKKRKGKLDEMNEGQKIEECVRMQPNMEEVEEQLFISFTSKEALRLHIPDAPNMSTPHSEATPESRVPAEEQEGHSDVEALQEKIATYQQTLLRDLKLMKHRQVIHPVLQEVGLKMSLLDPALSVDLQYLGVRLPIPPPGVSLESLMQNLPSTSDVPAGFMSRTGKTTDVTQIKGWREKFTTSEVEPSPTSSKPEGSPLFLFAGPSPDLQKKNLSAFCSDMLDEYLENEGKLIDERAASFSQPPADTPVFELPVRSTSYVRTMDHILKVQTAGSPASDLVSGFIPPSKRPRLKEKKNPKMVNRKRLGPKQNKPRPALGAAETSESTSPTQPILPTPEPTPEPPPENTQPSVHPPFKKRRKLKPKTSSQTLSPAESAPLLPPISRDLAPLESDSELGPSCSPTKDVIRKPSRTVTTRALLRQRDLEDSVVREGRYRTSITEERAAIALSSLFTLTGFVRENPTAPIQLPQRQKPSCLNEFCRLGCICASLTRTARVSHCGRFDCMFGCSCLKQKVVLLKNLENSDSSGSSLHGGIKKKRRKRKRRMKMAYVLKDSESVFQPAERVQNLWKKGAADVELEPVSAPRMSSFCYTAKESSSPTGRKNASSQLTSETFPVKRSQVKRRYHCSCARIRVYNRKQKTADEENVSKNNSARLKGLMKGSQTVRMNSSHRRSVSNTDGSSPTQHSDSSEAEPAPKPSKRLFIQKTCEWSCKADQNFVLKKLSKAVAQDELSKPFWVRKYLISPTDQTVQGTGADQCIHYRVRISAPKRERKKQAEQAILRNIQSQKKKDLQGKRCVKINQAEVKAEPEEDHLTKGKMAEHSDHQQNPEKFRQELEEGELPEDWQTMGAGPNFYKEEPVEDVKETELTEDWQKEGAGHIEDRQEEVQRLKPLEVKEEEEPLKNCLKEGAGHVEDWEEEDEEDTEEEEEDDVTSFSEDDEETSGEQRTGCIPFPFQTERSTDGLLSASLRQPGGKDQLVQVNGKDFNLARIELGRMGALHPANRLAAYLTGRATSTQRRKAFLLRCRRLQDAVSSAPSVLPATTTVALAPSTSQPNPPTDPQLKKTVTPTSSKAPQVLFLQVPGPRKAVPLSVVAPKAPGSSPNQQRMVLHPVPSLSGAKFYRKPDGKLVQLVPVCHMKTITPKAPAQGVVSLPPLNTSSLTVVSDPKTTGTSSAGSSFAISPSLAPLNQKPHILRGQRMIKIPLSSFNKDPVVLTIKAPPPPPVHTNLNSVKPPPSQEVKPGVLKMPVTVVPLGSGGVQHQPAAPPQPETPTCAPSAPPTGETSPQLELARHPADLDIVCVDEDTGVYSRKSQQVEFVDLSSDTDNSSDLRESESEDDKPRGFQREHLNQQARERRLQIRQMFGSLRREVGTSPDKLTKIGTLKRALEEIQELRSAETLLRRKKTRLKRRRDQFLSILVPSAEDHSDLSLKGAVDLSNKSIPLSSDTEEDPDPECIGTTFSGDSHGDVKEAKSQNNAPRVMELPDTPADKGKVLELLLSNQDKLSAGGGASAPSGHANNHILNTPAHLKPVLTPTWAETRQAAVLAPPLVPQRKTIPIILSRSKVATPSANNPAALQAGPPSSHIHLQNTSPGAFVPTPIPVAVAPVVLTPIPVSAVSSTAVIIPILTHQEAMLCSGPRPSTDFSRRIITTQPAAQKDPQPHTLHTQTDREPLRGGPDPPTPASHLAGVSRLSSSEESNLGNSSARRHGSGQNSDLQPPAPDSDGLSSLLDEIVFLNQQPISTATAGNPLSEDSSVVGGASEGEQAPKPNGPPASRGGVVQLGQTTGSGKGCVLAPPPLLHMKVGGAAVTAHANSAKTAAGGPVDGGGQGGAASLGTTWTPRPMPRLVPLGRRGVSPT
ncbi:MAX dimerization protein MGA a isoform X5 [Oryzias melastigma]|uniref:MAX dimerization protein MGA a isoform X5 n=1 Tax=Oryzias melastigma TaxID=30732 RepID=UPI00168D4FA3|nr:MAX dimerization protein MGA a isoform X5 [Oryzias melastigma]